MFDKPAKITLDEWDARHAALRADGFVEPFYGGPLGRHVADGDVRLPLLRYDNSPAALRLWNFLLSEEDRLRAAREAGQNIVGVMKDLGTTAAMAMSLPNVTAFYPDGAWWIPCVMEHSSNVLAVADSLGADESFCPVRAMLGAFATGKHFPRPDLLVCSAGAVCDDFSAIAQLVEGLGERILWWEMPARRRPDPGEASVTLPTGFVAPASQVAVVRGELERVARAIGELAGAPLDDAALADGIARANRARALLRELRDLAYTAEPCPMPALEMLIAEMIIIHYCSDPKEAPIVLGELLNEVKRRVSEGLGVLGRGAARVFWVNPVADLRVMNALEDSGGRVCGTELLFSHAMDAIPTNIKPMDAMAQTALADPMAGPAEDRGERICADIQRFGAEAVVISRIGGASHCALEGGVIGGMIRARLGLPVLEIEVPPVSDAYLPALRTRLEAMVEVVKERRR